MPTQYVNYWMEFQLKGNMVVINSGDIESEVNKVSEGYLSFHGTGFCNSEPKSTSNKSRKLLKSIPINLEKANNYTPGGTVQN